MRDVAFGSFSWQISGSGDLARVEGLAAFRELVVRWLLTEPSADLDGLVEEEVGHRRLYESAAARSSSYAAPAGERLGACLPWDPAWGAGIKSFLGAPLTADTLARVRTRVAQGLAQLEGVVEVLSVRVSSSAEGRLVVAWQVRTELGTTGESTTVEAV